MRDPINSFENKHKKKLISVDDLKDPINTAIEQKKVNRYVNKEAGLRSSLDNIYCLVIGQ